MVNMAEKTDRTWLCETCGKQEMDLNVYCTHCGTPRPSGGWTCSNCGRSLAYRNYAFCIHCGAKKGIRNEEIGKADGKEVEATKETKRSEPRTNENGTGELETEATEPPDEKSLVFCPPSYMIVGGRIGSGGFSDVYKARSSEGSIVALKFPKYEIGTTMPRSICKRFLKEARIWSVLKHEHIVEVYEFGSKPMPWISMEFMEGGSLSDKLKKGPMPIREALDIAIKIAGALSHAHNYGAIHQDVTPRNILFTRAEIPKLTDWGLAKVLLETSTSEKLFEGTISCAAPEQVDPVHYGKVDWRTDIYGFGVVLYWMLAGRPPFYADNLFACAEKITKEKTSPLHPKNPSIPQTLDVLLERTLAKRKEDRYEAMILVKKDLESILAMLNQEQMS